MFYFIIKLITINLGNLVPEELPEVRTRLVKEIWSTLERLNVPMDVSHYNALLRVYLENEHKFSPTEFLAQMEAKGIEPNRCLYFSFFLPIISILWQLSYYLQGNLPAVNITILPRR